MAGYLNESEILDAERTFHLDGQHNLYQGARILWALASWANQNSDGWCHWVKPRKAASGLIDVVDDARRQYLRGHGVPDITDEQLTGLVRPIKAFLTRNKVNQDDLPWAALLPLT